VDAPNSCQVITIADSIPKCTAPAGRPDVPAPQHSSDITIRQIFTGRLWHLTGNPWTDGESVFETFDRGALVVDADGRVVAAGNAATLLSNIPMPSESISAMT